MERHFFPAANTPVGFYSYFKNVAELKTCRFVHIKGGSGCGKSTFMKKIAKTAKNKGMNIEYLHCSSDPDSLDGIHIIDSNSVIFDSTAPHLMDPTLPGVNEIIFNTGDFIDHSKMRNYKEELLSLISQKSKHFQDCYRFLGAAKCLYSTDNIYNIRLIRSIADNYTLKQTYRKTGKERKLFMSGITPEGCVNFSDSVLKGKIIGINDAPGSSELLKEISIRANISGYDTDIYYCPMSPETKIEHLVIKDADISFTTVNDYHSAKNIFENISLPDTRQHNFHIKGLIDSAIDSLKKAKETHREIEKIYINSVDFDAIDLNISKITEFLSI